MKEEVFDNRQVLVASIYKRKNKGGKVKGRDTVIELAKEGGEK